MIKFFVLTLASLISLSAHAKRFDTSYLSLDIPDTWSCFKENTYWVCKDERQSQAEILLFLFAKIAKQDDSIRGIWDKLSQSKTITGFSSLPIQSKVYNIQMAEISNHQWVQALHGNSEIEGFASYYLATVYNNVSVLVSVSVVQGQYEKYKNTIANTMYSIRLKNIKVQEQTAAQVPQQKMGLLDRIKSGKFSRKTYIAVGLVFVSIVLLGLIRKS